MIPCWSLTSSVIIQNHFDLCHVVHLDICISHSACTANVWNAGFYSGKTHYWRVNPLVRNMRLDIQQNTELTEKCCVKQIPASIWYQTWYRAGALARNQSGTKCSVGGERDSVTSVWTKYLWAIIVLGRWAKHWAYDSRHNLAPWFVSPLQEGDATHSSIVLLT